MKCYVNRGKEATTFVIWVRQNSIMNGLAEKHSRAGEMDATIDGVGQIWLSETDVTRRYFLYGQWRAKGQPDPSTWDGLVGSGSETNLPVPTLLSEAKWANCHRRCLQGSGSCKSGRSLIDTVNAEIFVKVNALLLVGDLKHLSIDWMQGGSGRVRSE